MSDDNTETMADVSNVSRETSRHRASHKGDTHVANGSHSEPAIAGNHPDEVKGCVGRDKHTTTPLPPEVTTIFGDRRDRAVAYHESLRTDATTRGLIGPREAPRLWERHILNCAVIGEVMVNGARVVDIGSGAGLPGIPLALARPDLDITLIEPLLRRVTYLRETIDTLGLDNVTVVRGRAEEKTIITQHRGADYVTSRAVAPLGKLMQWSLPLTTQHGLVLAMKGTSADDEIHRDQKAISAAGGGPCTIIRVGSDVLPEATTIVRCERR